MNSIAIVLRECHSIVWKYRSELGDVWPTPSTEDALLFAFTELGEAIDAHLRTKPEYARNRDKDLSVLDELADAAMMVLTAIGRDFDEAEGAWWAVEYYDKWCGRHEWSIYATDIAELMYWGHHGDFLWEAEPYRLVHRIATHPGMDLPTRLTARLERIKAKRMPHPKIGVDAAYAGRWAEDGEKWD